MKQLLIFIFLAFLISSCKPSFNDLTSEVKFSKIPLPENKHAYSAIWLTKNTLIFLKVLSNEDFNEDYLYDPKSIVVNEELYSYNIDTEAWKNIRLRTDLNCHAQDIGVLERLPNGKLGLVQSCRENGHAVIREFDVSTYETKILFENHTYPNIAIKAVGTYSFSSNMAELVQENAIGMYLNNELYYIKLGEFPEQIVPRFVRAMNPAWSPHNREIAFWGTESYYGKKDPDLKTTSDIIGLASYSWDLYMSSPEGNNVHMVLSSIENPAEIAWSPSQNIIAFSGEFKGREGLWLFDPVSLEVTRIWNKRAGFSWSPDGTKIITTYLKESLDNFPDITIEEQSVNIIELPDFLSQ